MWIKNTIDIDIYKDDYPMCLWMWVEMEGFEDCHPYLGLYFGGTHAFDGDV